MKLVFIHLLLLPFLISCSGFNGDALDEASNVIGPDEEPVVIYPFDTFTLTSDQTEIAKMVVEPTASTLVDYGFNEANSGLRGRFLFDESLRELYYERSLISGTAWNDFTIYPPDVNQKLSYNLASISKVSVRVYAEVNGNGGTAQCGLAFGFGDTGGHTHAPSLSANLRLGGRDWSTATNAAKRARDYLRFSYEFSPTLEKVVVDAPINSYNQASEWSQFSAAEWKEAQGEVNFVPSASAALSGDHIAYTLDIISDTANNTLTISISDISSNLDLTGGESGKSFVWNYSQPLNYVDPITSNLRNGLDLTNVVGSQSLSFSDFQSQIFHLGFIGNQSARSCRYSDLQVTLK